MQGIQFQENFIQRLPAGLSVEQIIRQLAQPLVTAELVVPDFADHVLEREATYPTGLPTEPPCQAQCNCRRHPAGTGSVCRYGRRP